MYIYVYIKIYPRYTKMYNIPSKYKAAAGPAPAKGWARPEPARVRPLAWAGPAAA